MFFSLFNSDVTIGGGPFKISLYFLSFVRLILIDELFFEEELFKLFIRLFKKRFISLFVFCFDSPNPKMVPNES